MAAPESNNVTENDLFSALGIGSTSGSRPGGSTPSKATPSDGGKTSDASSGVGELDDDLLLDIFAPSSKRRSNKPSQEKSAASSKSSAQTKPAPKRTVDPDISAEREAQLKEKARRSRQWKEELQRQRREKEKEASVAASYSKTQWSQTSSSGSSVSGKEDVSSADSDVITVNAKPILLEDSDAREAREIRRRAARDGGYLRESTPLLGANVREQADVSASCRGMDDARVIDRNPRQDGLRGEAPTNPWAASTQPVARDAEQPLSSKTEAFKHGPVPEASQAERSNARTVAFDEARRDGRDVREAREPREPRGREASPQDMRAREGRPSDAPRDLGARLPQRSEGMANPDPRMQQPYAPYPPRMQQPPQYFDPRYAAQPGMPPYLQQQPPYEEEPENEGGGMRENPLGVILIVLAVLCVLVAASLLTGIWDISNL